MIFVKIVADILSGILNSLGGYHWLFCRRYIMPVILCISVSTITHIWWLGFTVLPVIGTLCLKYFSPQSWGRALWLCLQAIIIGLGLTILGHLAWYFYVPYILLTFGLGYVYKDWWQPLGDFVTGVWLGSILFCLH